MTEPRFKAKVEDGAWKGVLPVVTTTKDAAVLAVKQHRLSVFAERGYKPDSASVMVWAEGVSPPISRWKVRFVETIEATRIK